MDPLSGSTVDSNGLIARPGFELLEQPNKTFESAIDEINLLFARP